MPAVPGEAMFFAAAVPAVLLAGVSKGGFGGGAGFAATPLLALAVGPDMAVGMMLPLLMLMDATGLRAYWRRWSARDARAMMAGALPGIGLGAAFFAWTPIDATRLLIGGIALGFVAFRVARARGWIAARTRPFSAARAAFWGAAAGFTSFASHAGGPPATIHLISRGLDKTTFQATTVVLFWWINLVKLGPYWAVGLFENGQLRAALWLAPVALAGIFLGFWAHRRVPERVFFAVILAALTLTGAKLSWDGFRGLLG